MSEKEGTGVESGVVQLADDAYCDDKQNGDLQRNEQHRTATLYTAYSQKTKCHFITKTSHLVLLRVIAYEYSV